MGSSSGSSSAPKRPTHGTAMTLPAGGEDRSRRFSAVGAGLAVAYVHESANHLRSPYKAVRVPRDRFGPKSPASSRDNPHAAERLAVGSQSSPSESTVRRPLRLPKLKTPPDPLAFARRNRATSITSITGVRHLTQWRAGSSPHGDLSSLTGRATPPLPHRLEPPTE